MHDAGSKQLLFSRGFCSVFGEWQTTTPAREQWGTFHESLRFPWPKSPVTVTLKTTPQWPVDRIVVAAHRSAIAVCQQRRLPPRGNVWTVFENGTPAEKLDVVVLGDGYTSERHPEIPHGCGPHDGAPVCRGTVQVAAGGLQCPGRRCRVAVKRHRAAPRREVPTFGLGCEYNTFDLERYVLTADNRSVRDAAASAPYDNLIILFNNSKYGGGGIYNDQTTVAADAPFADYILVHEFGHHVAGLADEYYVSNVAYVTGNLPKFEPWEPNITALLDPSQLKWRDLLAADTPVPTPWKKAEYEASAKQTRNNARRPHKAPTRKPTRPVVMRKEQQSLTELFSSDPYAGKVGVFEGASYEAKGLYRPAIDCIMFSRNKVGFCPVCRRAINQAINRRSINLDQQSTR